jgi:hypothetical protein
VTTQDYHDIVTRTPGTRIARTTVRHDGDGVTVAVVPYAPPDVRRPQPSEELVEAVEAYLGDRTLLGERVTVRGPRYVGVDVAVTASSGVDDCAVETAVARLFHPVAGRELPFGGIPAAETVAARLDELIDRGRIEDATVSPRRGGPRVDLDDCSIPTLADLTVSIEGGRP